MLRELRDRMEQLMHGAAARAAEADVAEDGSAVVRLRAELERLRAELAKKDALLQELQSAHAHAKQVPDQASICVHLSGHPHTLFDKRPCALTEGKTPILPFGMCPSA